MYRTKTPIRRNDFHPSEDAERVLIIEDDDQLADGSHAQLLVSHDNRAAGALAFFQLEDGYGGSCMSLDYEATVALKCVLETIIGEYIDFLIEEGEEGEEDEVDHD